ncbi:hypothetical protein MVEG_01036 [Podila verticillata NRRL 6337]|nr:hypothetical protein MVEG_01036 [Podila verticillata NRRL 6337]
MQARGLFYNQEYTNALRVIQNAQQHPHMATISAAGHKLISMRAIHYHLQDLRLVEYCCRVLTQETPTSTMVEVMQQLNGSVLSSIGSIKSTPKTPFRTIFQLDQDPLIDQTLGILASAWKDLEGDIGPYSPSRSGPLSDFSPVHSAFASAALPFVQALLDRKLFPGTTDSRQLVLDFLLSAHEHQKAMQWIWFWDRRDRTDWLAQWGGSDIKHNLTAVFMHSDRPDLILDLFRLAHNATSAHHQWIRHLLITLDSLQQHQDVTSSRSLAHILYLADLDSRAFTAKREYNLKDSRKRSDIQHLWLESLQDPALSIQSEETILEQHLWRDMAMTGVLAREMTSEDILRIVGPDMAASIKSIRISHPYGRSVEQERYEYSDDLTRFLSRMASKDSSFSGAKDIREHKAPEMLKLAIQETMASFRSKTGYRHEDVIRSYRNLLHEVAHQTALRIGHLGLVSHVSELMFRTMNPEHIWSKTRDAADQERTRHLEGPPRTGSDLGTIPGVRDFIHKTIRSDLAKMLAKAALLTDPRARYRKGQLSDWYMTIADSSILCRHMARALQASGGVKPRSQAFEQAMWTLLQDQEYDLAASFHVHVHNLTQLDVAHSTRPVRASDLGKLVTALAGSRRDLKHLDLAQWIVDQHIARESLLIKGGSPSSKVIDIHTITELVGAWARRAEFGKARAVVEMMWSYNIEPNMVFYNTLLQALVDLTPVSKHGRRTLGGGKHQGMRELGRDLMVRNLLKSLSSSNYQDKDMFWDRPGTMDEAFEPEQSELNQGWDLFHQVVSKASEPLSQDWSEFDGGLDGPQLLKNMILQPSERSQDLKAATDTNTGRDSQFRPDAFTFAILLRAFARRGEIESISELFVQMKRLGLEPDLAICSILVTAFAKKGDLKSVERVVQEAKSRNMDLGLHLTNIVLDSLVEMDVPAVKIREVLDRMMSLASYEDENKAHHLDRMVDRSMDAFDGPSVRSSNLHFEPSSGPEKERVALDSVTFTTLVKYHTCRNNLHAAHEIFETMVQAGFVPDHRVYSLLLSTCIRLQDVSSGLTTVRAMRAYSGLFPDAKAWKGLLRCAMEQEQREMAPSKSAQIAFGHRSKDASGPVMSVLAELSQVICELGGAQPSFMSRRSLSLSQAKATRGEEGMEEEEGREEEKHEPSSLLLPSSDLSKEYLMRILTSSWISLPKGSNSHRREENEQMKNLEVKGGNGLLKRLLDHMFGPEEQAPGATSEQAITTITREQEERIDHAIWLVHFVESCGIELGGTWKWAVVGDRVQRLTGEEPWQVRRRLKRDKKEIRKLKPRIVQ